MTISRTLSRRFRAVSAVSFAVMGTPVLWCRARRFAARAGAVDNQDGFEGFELLKPSDERTTWLVVTRWRDQASFDAWLRSPAFGHGHRSAAECGGGEASAPGRHRVAAPATSLSRCRRFNALFVPLRGYGA